MVDSEGAIVDTLREEFRLLGQQLRLQMKQELKSHLDGPPANGGSVPKAPQWCAPMMETETEAVGVQKACMVAPAELSFVPLKSIHALGLSAKNQKQTAFLRSAKNEDMLRRLKGDVDTGPISRESTYVESETTEIVHSTTTESIAQPKSPTGESFTKLRELGSLVVGQNATPFGSSASQDDDEDDVMAYPSSIPGQVDNRGLAVEGLSSSSKANPTKSVSGVERKAKDAFLEKMTFGEKAWGIMRRSRTQATRAAAEEAKSPLQRNAIMIAGNSKFELVSMAMIVANSIQIGWVTDHMARNRIEDESMFQQITDLLFCVMFTLDIAIRLFAWRTNFFYMWGWGWNCFDFCLVIMQIFEEVVELLSNHAVEANSSLLRIVRILRVVRVVRVLRIMSLAKDLQLLVICIMHSFSNFLWAIALLFVMIYIASIYLTHVTLTRVLDGNLTEEEFGVFKDLYGDLPTTVLSLTQGLTGGIDWSELVNPLNRLVSPVVGFLLVFFILFTLLAVLNVITGNFVQTSLEGAEEVRELYRFSQARKMFTALDLDDTGGISYSEIEAHLYDPPVRDFFTSLDIDIWDAKSLFGLIDLDGSGVVDFDEFLRGCMRLQAPARTTDLLLVTRDFRNAFEQQWQAFAILEQYFGGIQAALQSLQPKQSNQDSARRGRLVLT